MDTLFVGKNCFKFNEIGSTNDWLMNRLSDPKVYEGSIVFALHQTNGKGQRRAKWVSQPYKSLTFSILLKPRFISPINAFDLSICIALALFDSLNKLRSGFKIKWPNDIYFQDKKIAGILIENQMNQSVYQNAVVGIGLNVNQVKFESLTHVTSLKKIFGLEFPLEQVMEHVCECVEIRYLQLRSGNFDVLKKEYLSNLYGYEIFRLYKFKNKLLNGKIVDILRNGHLQIELLDGEIFDFDIKEIEFQLDKD